MYWWLIEVGFIHVPYWLWWLNGGEQNVSVNCAALYTFAVLFHTYKLNGLLVYFTALVHGCSTRLALIIFIIEINYWTERNVHILWSNVCCSKWYWKRGITAFFCFRFRFLFPSLSRSHFPSCSKLGGSGEHDICWYTVRALSWYCLLANNNSGDDEGDIDSESEWKKWSSGCPVSPHTIFT